MLFEFTDQKKKISEAEKVRAFCLRHSAFFLALIKKHANQTAQEPKWTEEAIEKNKDNLDWYLLSSRTDLQWSEELLEKYKEKWIWSILSQNESIPWSVKIIDKYHDRWFEKSLADIEYEWEAAEYELRESEEKQEREEQREIQAESERGMGYYETCDICGQEHERCDVERHYHDDGTKQEDHSDNEVIESRVAEPLNKYLVWGSLSENPSLPWSEEFIEKYKTNWDWDRLSRNTGLPWTMELIERYQTEDFIKSRCHWDWTSLCNNSSLPWSAQFIEKYEKHIDWYALSSNRGYPWTEGFIQKYEKWLNWSNLSRNEALPWSLRFIKIYTQPENYHGSTHFDEPIEFVWEELSLNEALPWSEIINTKKLEDRVGGWNWSWYALSSNPALPWTIELLEKHWGGCSNEYTSDEFADVYNNGFWSTEYLVDNVGVWEKIFKPFIDVAYLDSIMKDIKPIRQFSHETARGKFNISIFQKDIPKVREAYGDIKFYFSIEAYIKGTDANWTASFADVVGHVNKFEQKELLLDKLQEAIRCRLELDESSEIYIGDEVLDLTEDYAKSLITKAEKLKSEQDEGIIRIEDIPF
jgi:hypothetical protein